MIIAKKLDEKKLKEAKLGSLDGRLLGEPGPRLKWDMPIDEKEATVVFEDCPPGYQGWWQFPTDEIHVVLDGKAEITYRDFPYLEDKRVAVEKGDVVLFTKDTRANFVTVGNKPYRHVCIIMPRYSYRVE